MIFPGWKKGFKINMYSYVFTEYYFINRVAVSAVYFCAGTSVYSLFFNFKQITEITKQLGLNEEEAPNDISEKIWRCYIQLNKDTK
jgi:hypothetical protein